MATIADPWPKRSLPDGHPADGMTLYVDVGDGAEMKIPDPRSFKDGGLEWTLLYGDADAVRGVAASVIGSYDYLLSGSISTTEAIRRLRLIRGVYREAAKLALLTQEEGR